MYKTKEFYGVWKTSHTAGGLFSAYCETRELAKEAIRRQEDQCDFSGFNEAPRIIKLQMMVEEDKRSKKSYVSRIKAIFNGFKDGTNVVSQDESSEDVIDENEKIATEYIEDLVLPSIEKVLIESKAPVNPRVVFSMEPCAKECDFVCGLFDDCGKLKEDAPNVKKTLLNCSLSCITAIKKIASEYGLYYFEDVLNDAEYTLVVGIDFNK